MYFHCVDAYLSRAAIYRRQGNRSLAIINYTLAMRLRPTDDEIYYRRGEIYEEEGDIVMAMTDYAKVSVTVSSFTGLTIWQNELPLPPPP